MAMPAQVLFIVGLLLVGINVVNAFHDFRAYSGTDLRCRVVGSRAMIQGINPYTLDYSPALPEALQDPDQFHKGIARGAYPPTLLLFYAPLSMLKYPLIRAISMLLEWFALILSISLLARTLRDNLVRTVFVLIAILGFAGSYFWRLHVERGHYHIFVTLLLACGLHEAIKGRPSYWKTGLWFGLALAIRPTVLVILLILMIKKYYKETAVALGIATIILLLTLPFGGLRFWQDWKALVDRYEVRVYTTVVKDSQPILERLPAEGFQPLKMLASKTANSSALGVLKFLRLDPGNTRLLAKTVVIGTVLLFLILFISANIQSCFDRRFSLAFAVSLSLIAEFIVPVRYGYADTQLLLLFAVMLPYLFHQHRHWLVAIMITGLFTSMWPIVYPKSDIFRPYLVILPVGFMFGTVILNAIIHPNTRFDHAVS